MGVRRTHRYDLTMTWTGNRGTGTSGYRDYGRDHEIGADGRPAIEGSSDPVFHGDKTRWNPELELVAALSQCHMLSYLHVCASAGVVVTAYDDAPYGLMAETEDGGGHFTEVVLRPRVTVADADMAEQASDTARGREREVLHRQFGELPRPPRAVSNHGLAGRGSRAY